MPTDIRPVPFDVEIPEGWTGLENPREGVVLEIALDDPVGFASRITIERFADLAAGPGDAGPMEQLIGERIVALTGTMTDARLLDLTLHGARPSDGAPPAFLATVAYLHGPHLVTAFIWALPAGDEALVLTGFTDADVIELDAGAFATIVDSVRVGEEADVLPVEERPLPLPDVPPRERPHLPEPPAGWSDVPLDDDRVLRQLVSDAPIAVPASIFVAETQAFPGDALERHEAVLEDLGSTMTDAELLDVGVDQLAMGEAVRSLVVFRQGDDTRTADLWTGSDQSTDLPTIWLICDFDDDAGREQAVAWVREATAQELGA